MIPFRQEWEWDSKILMIVPAIEVEKEREKYQTYNNFIYNKLGLSCAKLRASYIFLALIKIVYFN